MPGPAPASASAPVWAIASTLTGLAGFFLVLRLRFLLLLFCIVVFAFVLSLLSFRAFSGVRIWWLALS